MASKVSPKKKADIIKRRDRVAKLYFDEDMQQYDIAKELGVSQGTISNDIKALQKEWTTRTHHDIDRIKNRQLAMLDYIRDELFKAWENSEKGYRDASIIKQLHDNATQRTKLMGLDAPKRIEQDIKIDDNATRAELLERLKALRDD